jgi:hypothetical protein
MTIKPTKVYTMSLSDQSLYGIYHLNSHFDHLTIDVYFLHYSLLSNDIDDGNHTHVCRKHLSISFFFTVRKMDDDHRCHLLLLLVF